MFCPKCGNADQQKETFCRNCGTFLPDFDKLKSKENTPEAHLKANAFLSLMTAIVSLTLAILLYSFFLGKPDTPIIIYITAGFLTAMFFWQAQSFWRTLLLKKQFPKRNSETIKELKDAKTGKLLNEPDFENFVPKSVVADTTKNLDKIPRKSS